MKKRISLILAVIMIAAVVCTAIPFAAFATDTVTDDTVIIKIYTGVGDQKSATSIDITKKKLVDDFKAWANGLKTHVSDYDNSDITVEFVSDVDLADKPIHFIVATGKTLDIIGNNHTVTSSVDPGVRLAHNDTPNETINVKNLNVTKSGGAGFQLYNGSYTFDGCNITAATHRPIVTYAAGVTLNVTNSTFTGTLWNDSTANFTLGTGTVLNSTGNAVTVKGGALTVDGATINGAINNSGATVTLTSGTLNGTINGDATIGDAFVVNVPEVTTADPSATTQAPTTQAPTTQAPDVNAPDAGQPTDVIFEIYETGTTTLLKSVTRAEFVDLFANSNDILKTDTAFAGKNLTIEVKNDMTIPDSDKQCGLTSAAGLTVTINGNDHLFYGGKVGNPVLRFHGSGTFEINNLDLYHKGGSCVQYYGPTLNLNGCEWTTPDHYTIFPTNSGTVNINAGTVLTGSTVINYSSTGSNVITVAEGATLKGTGSNVIYVGKDKAGFELTVSGTVICEKSNGNALYVESTATNMINVKGGDIQGDVVLANGTIMILESGKLDGELDFDKDGAIVSIYDGFILNGEAYVDPSNTGDTPATDAPATDAPTTDAPVTDAPVTDAPATDAPATDAPATDAPTTEAPTENERGGCGGIAIAAQLVALICAAAVVIIKKK